MVYGLSRSETPSESLKRIVLEQIGRAVTELESDSKDTLDERVHAVRKRFKKLRALLQLVRGSLEPKDFRSEDRCIRDAARRLAAPRRAAACAGALEHLRERYASELPEATLERVTEILRIEKERALRELDEGHQTRQVADSLLEARDRIEKLNLGAEDWQAYRRGFRRVFARSRKALDRAEREPNTETLHEWRRWAKYHLHHARLLGPIWPELMKSVEKTLEELTEALGTEHDLDDLRMLLLEQPASSALSESLRPVLHVIEQRRNELRREALALGTRAFAERPKAATRRYGAYFASWREKAPELAVEPLVVDPAD